MKYIFILLLLLILSTELLALKPAAVNKYSIHEDGGLIYNPLSTYAKNNGQLLTENIPFQTAEFSMGKTKVVVSTPKYAEAYQVVPVHYSIKRSDDLEGQAAISANCFEKQSSKTYFDLNIPGKLSVTPKFLGTMTADIIPGARNIMKQDLSDTPGSYPNFRRHPFFASGTIEAGDIVWFRYRFTNTGDTILDPEGWGGWFYMAELHHKKTNGEWEQIGQLYNYYGRVDKYLYPGESTDVWFSFNSCQGEYDGKTPQNLGLVPGEYKVRLNFVYRWYKNIDNPLLNQWNGRGMSYYEQEFSVSKERKQTPAGKITTLYSDKEDSLKDPVKENKIPNWLHHFEEFMSGMEIHQNIEKAKTDSKGCVSGTVYVQLSPWTKYLSVKLTDKKMRIGGIQLPIKITDDLRVEYNNEHKYTTVKDGLRYPVIFTQNMADMRNHVHHTPYPEKHIWQNMLTMKECGINVIGLTAMPWLYDFIKATYIYSQPTEICNQNGDAMKYFLDIAREEGFQINGWGQYPFNRFSVEEIYNWLTGGNVSLERSSHMEISYDEPLLPTANSALWMYQFKRWGDLYFQTENGKVPFDVEDTRGWMRQDVNIRYPLGEKTIISFRKWCKDKYTDIETLNKVWNSKFTSFDEINPEKDYTPNQFGHLYEYYDTSKVFHDWSPAMEDLDLFRSEVRVKNYRETLNEVRKYIPGAAICIRTEGGNYLVSGLDGENPNSHVRHAFLSQRRAAVMADVLQKSDTIAFHSDYVTLPYTPDEISYLTRKGVSQGIIPIHLPQFDHMRDIAINDKYGTDYQITYNLPEPAKGVMMHCLTAVFPWWKALYEAGGVPGATWEDFECDGIVFETQRLEMKLFMSKLEKSMNTAENLKKRSENIAEKQAGFREQSMAKRSFILDRNVLNLKEDTEK